MQKSKLLRNFQFCLLFCFCASPLFAQEEGRRGFYGPSGEGGRWDSRRSSSRGEGGFGGRDFRGSEFRGGFRDGREMGGAPSIAPGATPAPVSSSGSPGTVSSPARTLVLQTRERVTVDLPSSFKEGDLDGDGQIAFYEWRQWKRGDLNGFTALDHNRDGFLTPAELLKGAASSVVAATSATPSTPASTVPGASAVSGGSSVSGMQSPAATQVSTVSASGNGADATANRAKSMFGLLDKNADGQLDEEEWKRSTRIRSQFTGAGIDLSGTMSKDAFVAHYVKLNSGEG